MLRILMLLGCLSILLPSILLPSMLLPKTALSEPLESVDSSEPGLTCVLKKLYRKNGVLTAKWSLNASSDFDNHRIHFKFKKSDSDCAYAMDAEKGVKYFPLTDKEGTPLASTSEIYLQKNSSYNLWMKLAAPPPEVKSISIVVFPCEPFDDIDITDK